MPDADQLYREKLMTAAEAISRMPKSGGLWTHHAVMEPKALFRELVTQRERFEKLRVHHMFRAGGVDITEPGYEKYFIDSPLFCGSNSRLALAEGRADFIPNFFHEVPGLIRSGRIPCDVAFIQVSPPDSSGNCSLGASVDYSLQAAHSAKLVIAQVCLTQPNRIVLEHQQDSTVCANHGIEYTVLRDPSIVCAGDLGQCSFRQAREAHRTRTSSSRSRGPQLRSVVKCRASATGSSGSASRQRLTQRASPCFARPLIPSHHPFPKNPRRDGPISSFVRRLRWVRLPCFADFSLRINHFCDPLST